MLLFVMAMALLGGTADAPSVVYREVSEAWGVSFRQQASPTEHKYLIETMGGGVGVLDFDSDGFLDLFLVNGFPLQQATSAQAISMPKRGVYADRLYRNLGGRRFEDATVPAGMVGSGYGMGVATGDYDNDGDVDVYVTRFGRNSLYRNEGIGRFTDVADSAGVAAELWSSSAAFLDYDRDGDLDLYVVRYTDWDFDNNPYCGRPEPGYRSYCVPDLFGGISDLLYRNNGEGTFTDVSVPSGIGDAQGKGLGVAFADYNLDGWIDIYVANDRWPCLLFKNNQDGSFSEVALAAGVAYNSDGGIFAGMGVDFQDYNNDGFPDLIITTLTSDMYVIYENNGNGSFTDVRFSSGIAQHTLPYTGWGTRFFDYDNDGWKDIFTANSHVMDNVPLYLSHVEYSQPPLLLRNLANGKFEDVSSKSGKIFQTPLVSRGAAVGDFDNDGDQDIVVSNLNGRPSLLLNEGGNRSSWILLRLWGRKSNRFGIGARVKLTVGTLTQYWTVTTASSYQSANDPRVHFGLGTAGRIDRLEIQWPSGIQQTLENLAPNQILDVTEPVE